MARHSRGDSGGAAGHTYRVELRSGKINIMHQVPSARHTPCDVLEERREGIGAAGENNRI